MKQSKKMSLLESKANAVIGLVVSWLFTFYGLPLLGIEPNAVQAAWITVIYFFLSFTRTYFIRRLFNQWGTR